MPHLSLKTLWRGPTMKLMVSILRVHGDSGDFETELINVDNAACIGLKFKCGSNYAIIGSIKMKKYSTSPNKTITIKIICGNLNDLFFCSDQWVEAALISKAYDKNVVIDNKNTLSYFIEVDITVHEKLALPLLPNLKLYEDAESTDFELHAADGKVEMHKTMLLGNSDVFLAMMRGEWKEKTEGHIKIDGVTVQTLQHLKDYIYLGILPDEGLQALLAIAARYLMDRLIADCTEKLIQSMKPEDFDGLVKLACQHNIPELVRALVLQIPDSVVNGIHQLKINDEGS